MTFSHSHSARNCIICGKTLEDAASLEVGIGPICRKKANEVLAKEIPADLPKAQGLALALATGDVPEVAVATLDQVKADIALGTTKDWRATVKRCAWLLSFSPSAAFQGQIVSLVAALGYVGFAGLLTGEASTGAARVFFHEGRLHLEGPKNKAGREALKAACAGARFHAAVGEAKATWSCRPSQADAFLGVVAKFWPFAEGAEGALEALLLWEQENPTLPAGAPAAASVTPKCKVVAVAGGKTLQVFAPYSGAFVADIKTLPYKDRSWDGLSKCWAVKASHEAQILALVAKHYGETVAVA